MKHFLAAFQSIKNSYDSSVSRRSGLTCTTNVFEGCPGVRLFRTTWMSGKSGIFFSIWTDEHSESALRLHYNIHALKLRQLKPYVITSRNFAEEFRQSFETIRKSWPNVSVEYGPQNLMQGWIEYRIETFESDALRLLRQFSEIAPVIDGLLEERIAPARHRQ